MKSMSKFFISLLFFSLICFYNSFSQNVLKKNRTGAVEAIVSKKGNLLSFSLDAIDHDSESIELRDDEFAGPSLLLNLKI